MSEIKRSLEKLQERVKTLMVMHSESVIALQTLRQKNKSLSEELAEKEEVIASLKDELVAAKIANNSGGEGNAELKRTVTELLREVDQCIALLNK